MTLSKGQNSPRSAFQAAEGADPATRKAFFEAIRKDDAAAVTETLAQYPGAICWQEPFKPEDKPFAADNTPLMTAAENRKGAIGSLLIDHGAATTMNQQNSRGWTALMFASWHGVQEIAEKLLWAGADTQLRNEGNHDVATMAGLRDHTHIKRTIEQHRQKHEGAAAFQSGTNKTLSVMPKIKIRK
jgi:hypothetical protein